MRDSTNLKCLMKSSFQFRPRGNHSSAVCAYWASTNWSILNTCQHLRVGVIQYLFKYTITIPTSATRNKEVSHVFSHVHWYQAHLGNPGITAVLITSPGVDPCGPAMFLPVDIFLLCNNFKDCNI